MRERESKKLLAFPDLVQNGDFPLKWPFFNFFPFFTSPGKRYSQKKSRLERNKTRKMIFRGVLSPREVIKGTQIFIHGKKL